MKITSTHPAHISELASQGFAVVNGLRFTRGEQGLPTCDYASERDCNNFKDVPGFSFYHDDGALAGESSLKEYRPSLDVVTAMLQDGTTTLEDLRAMDLQIVGFGSLNALIDKAQKGEAPDGEAPGSTGYDEDASEQSALQQARRQPTGTDLPPAAEIPTTAPDQTVPPIDLEVRAQVASDLGVPESDVTVHENHIELTGQAAEQAGEGLNEEGTETGGQAQDEAGTDQAQAAEGDEAPSEPDGETAPEPDGTPDAELSNGQLKQHLTTLGVKFGPRDNHAALLDKYTKAKAAAQQ